MPTPSIRFHPRLGWTLLTLALIALFVQLGQWQLGKAHVKQAAQARLDSSRGDLPLVIGATPLDASAALRPVQVRGHYDAAGQILIDNRVHAERAGLHVLTPLVIEGSKTRVLVNRGWIPAPPTRAQAVVAPVPSGPQVIRGTAVLPASRIFALAPDTAPAGANAIWQNLDLARYRQATPFPVQGLVVLLGPQEPGGFVRDWPRLDDRHERHLSYAYQWFGFAFASLAIWAYFSFRPAPGVPLATSAAGASAARLP